MIHSENINKPFLLNTKNWFKVTSEFNSIESDIFFKELINIYLGNEININLPKNISNALGNYSELISENDQQIKESHWNWKGGISDENNLIRSSSEYKKWRLSVFIRDNFICQSCNKKGRVLNAHHIIPFSIDKNLRFELSNGITLCKGCHIELHKTERPWH
ncbi:MAG: HNH endonuclease [Cytophagaceae bacterium]|nr:HNH endonuclease [Cytophagaceae bacterium]MBL0304306.1 HNH endonuclease [Cytophagaceae bacterium]MBL0323601.1 HNH endonuclease [Cytophagaceae bacterium]